MQNQGTLKMMAQQWEISKTFNPKNNIHIQLIDLLGYYDLLNEISFIRDDETLRRNLNSYSSKVVTK